MGNIIVPTGKNKAEVIAVETKDKVRKYCPVVGRVVELDTGSGIGKNGATKTCRQCACMEGGGTCSNIYTGCGML